MLDLPRVLDRLEGDRELLQELIEVYFEETPLLVDAVTSAVRERDKEGLAISAHTLKGALSNFCDSEAVTAAESLEAIARAGDFTNSSKQIDNLKEVVSRLSGELTAVSRN